MNRDIWGEGEVTKLIPMNPDAIRYHYIFEVAKKQLEANKQQIEEDKKKHLSFFLGEHYNKEESLYRLPKEFRKIHIEGKWGEDNARE